MKYIYTLEIPLYKLYTRFKMKKKTVQIRLFADLEERVVT